MSNEKKGIESASSQKIEVTEPYVWRDYHFINIESTSLILFLALALAIKPITKMISSWKKQNASIRKRELEKEQHETEMEYRHKNTQMQFQGRPEAEEVEKDDHN